MKWLVDAQLSRRLCLRLREAGHDVVHTSELPDGNRTTDSTINTLSIQEERIVITKDSDFVASYYLRGVPWKLLLISTGNVSNAALESMFMPELSAIAASFEHANLIELTSEAWVIHD